MAKTFKILENEFWWGGSVIEACNMPYSAKTNRVIDMVNNKRTQTSPLLLSSKGRYIWFDCEAVITIKNGEITVDTDNVDFYDGGKTLRDAYIKAMEKHFPNEEGKHLPEVFFKKAQYNTWIELMYNQNQKEILEYAENIVKNGYEPGILIIDEGWQKRYGLWEFDLVKFPDPKAMIARLHKMGFVVMLWVVPYISADSPEFRQLWNDRKENNQAFIRDPETDLPAIVQWWNGFSAIFNFTQEKDREFLSSQLDKLIEEYGVDGFKFDGGSYAGYKKAIEATNNQGNFTAEQLNHAWFELGAKYEFHEFKDTWKFGGRHTIQRLYDKDPVWDENGIKALIPHGAFVGLLGHPYICPDMIGGGEYSKFLNPDYKTDQELFVRMAQCSALWPMMQYSLSPWKVLDNEHQAYAKEAAMMHKVFSDVILEEVKKAENTGEPVIRLMEYNYPGCGYEEIADQFMVGENILVAPVVVQGAITKDVVLPCGKWQDLQGNEFEGGKTITVEAPINVLPVFKKIG